MSTTYNPFITFPTSGEAIDATIINQLTWNFLASDDSITQFSYQVEILDFDNVTQHDSGIINSTDEFYDLPASTLTNGNEYKWRVTVNGTNTNRKASVFRTHDEPSATVDVLPFPFLTQFYNFTGTVTQAQSVDVFSFEWFLYDSLDVLITSSGTIESQTVEYEFTDLDSGTTYKVDYFVTMQDGLTTTSDRLGFTPSYTAPVDPDLVEVSGRTDLIMNVMNWSAVVTQTGEVYDSTDTIITPTYVTGVWNQALRLLDGEYLLYDLNAPIPFEFSSDYWISLDSGFDGNFFELYDVSTNELEYQIGYSQEIGAFYYQRGGRRTTGGLISIPIGFFKVIVTPRTFGYKISSIEYIVR